MTPDAPDNDNDNDNENVVAVVAERLRAAERDGVVVQPVRHDLPANVDVAYAVQALNTDHAVRSGRRLIGRKIGLTSAAVQAQLGVDEPDFGMLFADMCFCDGEEVPIERVLQPRVEAEIALVLARDLPGPDLTVLDLLAATAFALPALELVGSRVANWDITIVDTVADNASSGLFVLGTRPVAIDAFDPRLCGMILEVDGVEAALGAGAACMGNPFNAALWLARRMAAVRRPLLAGDVVLTGALGPMVPVRPGQTVEARIEDVGVVRAELAEVAS